MPRNHDCSLSARGTIGRRDPECWWVPGRMQRRENESVRRGLGQKGRALLSHRDTGNPLPEGQTATSPVEQDMEISVQVEVFGAKLR